MSYSLTQHREKEASASVFRHKLELAVKYAFETPPMLETPQYEKVGKQGALIVTRKSYITLTDKNSIDRALLSPMELGQKIVKTQIKESKTIGNDLFEFITHTPDAAERVIALKETINDSFTDTSCLGSVSEFTANADPARVNEIFHVRSHDQPDVRQIHFSSADYYTATITLTGTHASHRALLQTENRSAVSPLC